MKKLTYLLLGATGLILTSCANDDFSNIPLGETASITISLNTPQLQTRTFGDGKTATKLQYAVFEKIGGENILRSEYVYDQNFTSSAAITLKLANDHSYNIVFWAAAETDSPYTVNFRAEDGPEMTVNYEEVKANDEHLDAFFASLSLDEISGDAQLSVDLKRPFAQINVGTNDFTEFETSTGTTIATSYVAVDKAYQTLNLISGEVSDPTNDVTFAPNDVPSREEEFKKEGYDYLAMVYFLASPDSENRQVSFGYTENGNEQFKSRTISDVPLQRNHRTNIYGSLLTSNQDVNVDKDPDFDGDEEQEIVTVPDNKVKYDGEVFENIETAIASALEAGDNTPLIYVGEGTFKSDEIYFSTISDLTLKGVGNKANTIIEFDNAVYSNKTKADAGVKNVTMESLTVKMKPYSGSMNENSNAAFIHLGKENYIDCIIEGCVRLVVDNEANFENCVFNNTEKSGYNGYAIWHSGASGSTVNVKGCEFNTVSKGILLYYSGETLELNLNVEDSKFTASQKDDKAAIMINTQDVSKAMYGTVRIKNTTATGFDDRSKNGLWLEEKNGTAEATTGFDVYIDDKIVQSTQYFKVDDAWYLDAKTAFAAIKDNSVVEFGTTTVAANTVTWPTNKTLTFLGKAKNSGINNIEWQAATGCDLTVKNLTIDVLIRSGNHTSMGFKGLTKGYFENVTFNGEWHTYDGPQTYKKCIFNYVEDSDPVESKLGGLIKTRGGRYNVYNYSRDYAEFIGCEFNSRDNKALLVFDNENTTKTCEMHDLLVEDSYFTTYDATTSQVSTHACVEVHSENYVSFATVTINNCSNDGNFKTRGLWYECDNSGSSLTAPKQTFNCTFIVDGKTVQPN